MTPADRCKLEESLVATREFVPRLWWNLYQGCLQAGFAPPEAFALVQTYVLAQSPHGIRPNEPGGLRPGEE